MSLLKPRIMTPARLAASRRNSQKSTGPRTARGYQENTNLSMESDRDPHPPTAIKNENYSSQLVDNKGQKSAPNKLLIAKDDEKKDVKNEGCSQ